MVGIQVIQFNTKSHPLVGGFNSKVRDGIVPMALKLKNTINWSLNLELSEDKAQC